MLSRYPIPPGTNDTRPLASQVATDYTFVCAGRNVSRAMSKYVPTYNYLFDHVPSFSVPIWAPLWGCFDKVCHASDLPFVFDSAEPLQNYTSDEQVLAYSMLDYWTNFAYNGDPNSKGSQMVWPKYTPDESLSMYFQTPSNSIYAFYRDQYCSFWDLYGFNIQQ